MNIPRPITQVILRIDKSFQDEIITDSGLKLFLDPSYSKEHHVTVTATVVALPIKPSEKDKKIIDQLSVGDEVSISYRIVCDFEFKSDAPQFMQATEDNPYHKEFVNGKGEWIRVYALPKRKGIEGAMWVGVYQNKFQEVISGAQGSEEDVERWLAQFPLGKTDIYTFNNFFEYQGKEYWKCNPEDIFAKKVKGHLVAVGNRAICRPIDEDVPVEVLQNVQHNTSVKIRYQDRAKVLTADTYKGVKKDYVVSFNPNHSEKYEFYGRQYYLINQNFIQGKWN